MNIVAEVVGRDPLIPDDMIDIAVDAPPTGNGAAEVLVAKTLAGIYILEEILLLPAILEFVLLAAL